MTTDASADTAALAPIPTAPRAFPLLGHAAPLLRDPLAFLKSLPAHGDLVRIRIGPMSVVVVCDADLTQRVLRDDRTFDKGGPLVDRAREVVGNSLVNCPHSDHRRMRRLVQPYFHPDKVRGYAPAMTAHICEVTDSWRNGQVLDVLTEMGKFVTRTLTETLFGDTLPTSELQRMHEDVMTCIAHVHWRMLWPEWLSWLPVPANKRYGQAHARLHRVCTTAFSAHHTGDGGLLSALRPADKAHSGEGTDGALSRAECVDNAMMFFITGIDTTPDTLAWSLLLLARHPDIAASVRAEVDTVLGDRPATHSDLPRLELTQRVLTETLRLYPAVWLVTRTVTSDTRLGRHCLPAGTPIICSPYVIHHRPDVYPDPERFDPDRWKTRPTAAVRNALIPFGSGARKCLGDAYAFTQSVLALATITMRWRLELLPGARPFRPRVTGATLPPRNLRLRAVARSGDRMRRAPGVDRRNSGTRRHI